MHRQTGFVFYCFVFAGHKGLALLTRTTQGRWLLVFAASTAKVQHDGERLIYRCFTFRNLHHCQGGLSTQRFITAAVLRPLPNVSLQNILVQINASNLASWYLYWPFNERFITDHFCLPESPKGALCSGGESCPNGGVNHASYDDYSTLSLYRMKNDFVIENVTLPFPQICSNETGKKNSEGLTVHLCETRKPSFLYFTWSSDITGGSSSHEPRSLHRKNLHLHIPSQCEAVLPDGVSGRSDHSSPCIAAYFCPDKISRHRS